MAFLGSGEFSRDGPGSASSCAVRVVIVVLWSFTRLVVNGDVAAAIFFGSFLAVAIGVLDLTVIQRCNSATQRTSIVPPAGSVGMRAAIDIASFRSVQSTMW